MVANQPPYTVVLDARTSPIMMNVTLPLTDNALVYINRAAPDTDLYFDTIFCGISTNFLRCSSCC